MRAQNVVATAGSGALFLAGLAEGEQAVFQVSGTSSLTGRNL